MPSRLSFGFALAKDLKRLEDSCFSAGLVSGTGAGAGVDSLLEGVLLAAGLDFSLPFPKKSFAAVGWEDLVSALLDEVEDFDSGAFGFTAEAFAGTGAGALAVGGGRRPVRRLTFLLTIVPYLGANSKGSSPLHSS